MFEPVTEEDFGVKIALCAPEQTEVLQHADFVAFGELSAELIAQQQFDLLLVVGASPLQTALVKYWCEESGCIAACVETLDKNQCDAENVIVNLKDKFEGREFPNNVDVADVRHLAYDDNQLLAFSTKAQLLNFLSDQECPDVTGVFYLMHGEFCVDRFKQEHVDVAQYVSENATIFYSYLSKGLGECTALVSVRR